MYSFYARGYSLHSSLPKEWDKDAPREMAFVADKKLSIQTHKAYMLSRLMEMFEYKNLPETIPSEMLELQLLLNGVTFVTKVNGELYALEGSPGGEPDPYYRPTKYVWANPALKESRESDLWKDGVLFRNDKLWIGLSPLINKYAAILAENEITIRVADIMLRIVAMISTPDDNTKVAAEEYLKKILNGKLGALAENRFFDGVKMQSPPSNNGSYLTQFIELQQYMKASFYNEVGMQANYNMKRENIGSGETAMNQNATLPLCDQMLAVRREDVSRLNEMYDLDVSVDFNSAWKLNAEQLRLEVEQLKAELEETKASVAVGGVEEDSDGSNGEEKESEDGESTNGSEREEKSTSDDDVSSGDDSSEDGESAEEAGEQTSDADSGSDGSDEVVNREEGDTVDSDASSEDAGEDGDASAEDSSTSESLEVSQLTVDVNVEISAEGGEDDDSEGSEDVE